jgi:hypothetical protein
VVRDALVFDICIKAGYHKVWRKAESKCGKERRSSHLKANIPRGLRSINYSRRAFAARLGSRQTRAFLQVPAPNQCLDTQTTLTYD